MEIPQDRVAPVQKPVRLPGQESAALGLRDHGPIAALVLTALQKQIGGIIVKVVERKAGIRRNIQAGIPGREGGDPAAVAVKQKCMDAAALLQRGGGQTGAQGGVIRRRDAVL